MDIDLNNLPEELTIDVYLYVNTEYGGITITEYDFSNHSNYAALASPVSVTFKTKNKEEVLEKVVDSLRAESQKIRADAEVQCQAIDEKINTLLALPDLNDD